MTDSPDVPTKTLVILTTHFGTNFSGGSTATCEIFSRLEHHYRSIVVVGTELGDHSFTRLKFIPYRSQVEAIQILHKLKSRNMVFYGDFYVAYLLAMLRLPFFFTYHDNWPELGLVSTKYRLQGLYYWTLYKWIFKKAAHIFAVSDYKRNQVSRYTNAVKVIRNGIGEPSTTALEGTRHNTLMVGTVDERKYAKAVELFKLLPTDPGFSIDVFGHTPDRKLLEKLKSFPFVTIKGFNKNIPYESYNLLLHTSLMENLSIVWCEALARNTPVLSFNVGAAAEIVNSENGILIEAYQVAEMAERLIQLNITPVSVRGASNIIDTYSWDRASDQYHKTMRSYD